MPKSRSFKSEQRKQEITEAIWKFSAAFLQRGVIRNFSLHKFLASILYLMKMIHRSLKILEEHKVLKYSIKRRRGNLWLKNLNVIIESVN